jgi:hypothetical protein
MKDILVNSMRLSCEKKDRQSTSDLTGTVDIVDIYVSTSISTISTAFLGNI